MASVQSLTLSLASIRSKPLGQQWPLAILLAQQAHTTSADFPNGSLHISYQPVQLERHTTLQGWKLHVRS